MRRHTNQTKRTYTIQLFLVFLLTLGATFVSAEDPVSDITPVYRLWSAQNGDHFYTTDAQEAELFANQTYKREGILGYIHTTQVAGTIPLHRMWNAKVKDHFYTTLDRHVTFAQEQGWEYEGIIGYVHKEQTPETTALYGQWSPKIRDHFYTTNEAEAQRAQENGYKKYWTFGYVYKKGIETSLPLPQETNFVYGERAELLTPLDTTINYNVTEVTNAPFLAEPFDYYNLQGKETLSLLNTNLEVVHREDENDNVGDFLFSPDTSTSEMFNYTLAFSGKGVGPGMLHNKYFPLLGSKALLIRSDEEWNSMHLALNPQVVDRMKYGETKHHTIDGKRYAITLYLIENQEKYAQFTINEEHTRVKLRRTTFLDDNTRITLHSMNEDEVILILDYTEASFDQKAGSKWSVEINNEVIEEATAHIEKTPEGRWRAIHYTLSADTLIGDLYVPQDWRVGALLDEPEGMLSPKWDITYGGLTGEKGTPLTFTLDKGYWMTFTDTYGELSPRFASREQTFKLVDSSGKPAAVWVEREGNVKPGDTFIANGYTYQQASQIATYEGKINGTYIFTSPAGLTMKVIGPNSKGKFHLLWNAPEDAQLPGVTLADVPFTENNGTLTVDLNRDGEISGYSFIYIKGQGANIAVEETKGHVDLGPCDINCEENNALSITLNTPSNRIIHKDEDETIKVDFSVGFEGVEMHVDEVTSGLKLEEHKDHPDVESDMSPYGVLVSLQDPEDSHPSERLTLWYPEKQRLGRTVFDSRDTNTFGGGCTITSFTVEKPYAKGNALVYSIEEFPPFYHFGVELRGLEIEGLDSWNTLPFKIRSREGATSLVESRPVNSKGLRYIMQRHKNMTLTLGGTQCTWKQ